MAIRPAAIRPPGTSGAPPTSAARAKSPTHAQVDAAVKALEQMDYFQILQIDRHASPSDVKRAFHRISRGYHPDRFYGVSDQPLKDKINQVYRRMTEAYYVLRDDAKRARYLADIDGPDRAKKLRFTEEEEAQAKVAVRKELEEQIGTHPKARQFYKTGLADLEAHRWSAAERNFKMALTFEPANIRYKEKLAEAEQRIRQETKDKGDPFKIK